MATIFSSKQALVLAGFAFLSQSVLASAPPKGVEEKTLFSPNHFFQLKIVPCEMYKGVNGFRMTLSAKSQDGDGVEGWHEFWTKSGYTPDDADFVTDSGRVLQFSLITCPSYSTDPRTGAAISKIDDLASMYVWDTDGRELAGIGLQEFGFHKLAEVRWFLQMDKTKVGSAGMTTRSYEGLEIPVATQESYTLVYRDGTEQRFRVGRQENVNKGTWSLMYLPSTHVVAKGPDGRIHP